MRIEIYLPKSDRMDKYETHEALEATCDEIQRLAFINRTKKEYSGSIPKYDDDGKHIGFVGTWKLEME